MKYVIDDKLLGSLISDMGMDSYQIEEAHEALEIILQNLDVFDEPAAFVEKLWPDGVWKSSISWDDPNMTIRGTDDDLVKSLTKLARTCYIMFIHPCE